MLLCLCVVYGLCDLGFVYNPMDFFSAALYPPTFRGLFKSTVVFHFGLFCCLSSSLGFRFRKEQSSINHTVSLLSSNY